MQFPCRIDLSSKLRELRDGPLSQFQFLGLHGLKRSGKDTFLNGMRHAFGDPSGEEADKTQGRVRKAAFGDPLKEAAQAIFGGDRAWYHGSEEERSRIDSFWLEALGPAFSTGRKVLQTFGTEVMREGFCEDIWMLASIHRILEACADAAPGTCFVFSDIRFGNEAAFCRWLGAPLFQIINLNQERSRPEHASERPVDATFDRVISSESAEATFQKGWSYGLGLSLELGEPPEA